MHTTLMLAGENSLLHEALKYTLDNNGYSVLNEGGKLPVIKKSIRESSPDVIVWDDAIIMACFGHILEIARMPTQDVRSVLILDSRMLQYMAKGLLNGVNGFVHKKNGLQELKRCLSAVRRGSVYISPDLSGRIEQGADLRYGEFCNYGLTRQEAIILRLLYEDNTSREIAGILHISYRTVQNHRQNICNKLGLSGRNKLYEYAQLHFSSERPSDA